jgi:hypothetical protein
MKGLGAGSGAGGGSRRVSSAGRGGEEGVFVGSVHVLSAALASRGGEGGAGFARLHLPLVLVPVLYMVWLLLLRALLAALVAAADAAAGVRRHLVRSVGSFLSGVYRRLDPRRSRPIGWMSTAPVCFIFLARFFS